MKVNPKALDAIVNLGSDEEMTIREYLQQLLYDLWWQGEGFSSKRPFGNSGWQIDLTHTLVRGGFVEGHMILDKDGYLHVTSHDYEAAHKYISELIQHHLFRQ